MYMLQQRVISAVRDGYAQADVEELRRQLIGARAARAWLEALAIEPEIRAWLVEPIEAVEEALAETARRRLVRGGQPGAVPPRHVDPHAGQPTQAWPRGPSGGYQPMP